MPTKSDTKKRTGPAKAKSAPKAKAPAPGAVSAKKKVSGTKAKAASVPAKAPAPKRATKAAGDRSVKPGKSSKAAPKPAAKASASAARFSKKPSGSTPVASAPLAPPKPGAGSMYSVHPGVQMMVRWASELKSKTGRTLDEWVALLKKDAPAAFEDRVAFLKSKHAMGTNAAWWIAERADGKGAEDLDPDLYLAAASKYVDEQYEGKKAKLRPLYETLLRVLLSLDARAKACPCKTMVPIYFDHVVAQLKPTTNTRIDLGLALGETKGTGRLIETGGFAKKDRITHRLEITSEADIDEFVKGWVQKAYARG
jgi:hypothetical protein